MMGIPKSISIAVAALILAILAALLGGACGFTPGGGAPLGPKADANNNSDGGIDAPRDATSDASPPPQLAQILFLDWLVEASPDEGVTIDRFETALFRVNALSCAVTADEQPGWGMSILLPAVPGEQGSFFYLPVLGLNTARLTCEGDPGTSHAVLALPPIRALSFVLSGVELLAAGRYRLPNRGTAVTWTWDLPGEQPGLTCSGGATPAGYGFTGALECPSGSLGPTLATQANGPAVTVSYTVSGPLGYRGTVTLEVPASQ